VAVAVLFLLIRIRLKVYACFFHHGVKVLVVLVLRLNESPRPEFGKYLLPFRVRIHLYQHGP